MRCVQMIMKAGHGGNSGRFQRMQETAEVRTLSTDIRFDTTIQSLQVFAFAVWAIQWRCRPSA
jgi:hypothetical protein